MSYKALVPRLIGRYKSGDLVLTVNRKQNKFISEWNKQPFKVIQDEGASVFLETPNQRKYCFHSLMSNYFIVMVLSVMRKCSSYGVNRF